MVALLALLLSRVGCAVSEGFKVALLDSSLEAGEEMDMPVAGMVIVLCCSKGDVDVKPLLKGQHGLLGYLPEVEIFAGVFLFSIRAYNDPEKDRSLLGFIYHLVGVKFSNFAVSCIKGTRCYHAVLTRTMGNVAN